MNARITSTGMLVIRADNETELFAMIKWAENYEQGDNSSRFVMVTDIKNEVDKKFAKREKKA